MSVSPNSSEIEKLKALIKKEEEKKHSVEKSYNELLSTSKELEKRMILIDEESNEWKTRFDNQEEINRQLIKQIGLLEAKLEETKTKSKNIKNKLFIENNKEIKIIKKHLPEHLIELEKIKEDLLVELKDYGWRIEQENKAYHKANEERKEIHQDILDTRNQITFIKDSGKRQKNIEQITSRRPDNPKFNLPSVHTSQNGSSLDTYRNQMNNSSLNNAPKLSF